MENNRAMEPTTEPGTYTIYDAAGNYAGWQRHYKDARYHAFRIGGKAVKVKASAKPATPWTGDTIRMKDGSFAPMTKANIKIAQGRT